VNLPKGLCDKSFSRNAATNGYWKRSRRSSPAMLQRRRNLMRRRPFSRNYCFDVGCMQ